jgi:formylglycine-generating enzyme required for sulfatase activity
VAGAAKPNPLSSAAKRRRQPATDTYEIWLGRSVGVSAPDPAASSNDAALAVGTLFRDCADETPCPTMIVLPAGKFLMGSPDKEKGHQADESPQHEVTIPASFAVMKAEVTRGQFAQFVQEQKYQTTGGCYSWVKDKFELNAKADWRNPGFEQTDLHPAVCISWNDAAAYAKWLSGKTGKTYRLLSEAEWEYAARAGSTTRYSFGDRSEDLCSHANVADRTAKAEFKDWTIAECSDGFVHTAPVKTYRPNTWGLYDLHDNAWEWVADCWHKDYKGAPSNGSAWTSSCAGGERRVLRGGGWSYFPDSTRSADRNWNAPHYRNDNTGFRLARTLTP